MLHYGNNPLKQLVGYLGLHGKTSILEVSSKLTEPIVAFTVDVKASPRFPWLEDMAHFTDSYTHALKIRVPCLHGVTVGRIWLHVGPIIQASTVVSAFFVPDKKVDSVI
jgi:hypothetical protein